MNRKLKRKDLRIQNNNRTSDADDMRENEMQ